MYKPKMKVDFLLQGPTEPIEEFKPRLQVMLDEITARDNIRTPPMCMPTASASGRLHVLVQWVEEDPHEKIVDEVEKKM